MSKGSLQGRLALVTGASSGLGVDFARELAGQGCNLILVARREERLQTVGQEMVDRFGVAVHVVPADLVSEEAREQLYERVQAMGQTVDVLVNNAGFGIYGLS